MDYDKFKLHRVGDGEKNKNLSENEKRDFRISMGANADTGLYNTNTGNKMTNIDNLGQNLGLVDKSGPVSNINYKKLAEEVGMENVDPINIDYDELERRLQDIQEKKLAEEAAAKEAEENTDYYKRQENRKYKSNDYYKKKREDLEKRKENLQRKVDDAYAEKGRTHKKIDPNDKSPLKADGSDVTEKNALDKLKDRRNLLQSKRDLNRINRDLLYNRVADYQNKINKALNPVEAAEEAAKEAVKEAVDKKKEAAKKAVKAKTKEVKKAAKKKVAAFLAKNPWFIAVILGIIFFVIIIVIIVSVISDEEEVKKYDSACDFNLTYVNFSECNSETSQTMSLDQYVTRVAKAINNGNDYNSEQLKALMIIIKTNALIKGNYDNVTKSINIDDCDINSLYSSGGSVSSNPGTTIVTSSGWWWPVGSSSASSGNIYGGSPVSSVSSTYPDGVSSYFGAREAPTSGASTDHGAIDIPIPSGTPVIAANNGTIKSISSGCVVGDSSCGGGYGNNIRITHSNGIETLYAHLSSVSVSQGQSVVKGQLIGYSGNTGISTGAHLHFGVIVNGTAVDPLSYVSLSNPRNGSSSSTTSGTASTDLVTVEDEITTLYKEISDYLYINTSYKKTIENLNDASILQLDSNTLTMLKNETGSYSSILSNIYNGQESNLHLYSLEDNCDYDLVDANSLSYGDLCGGISLTSTSLSKSDYVSALERYYSNASGLGKIKMRDNAATIYDLSANNSFNPELIPIRAELEGYSPGGNTYNYYGIGCFNGGGSSVCKSYDSFSSGALAYINLVKSYNVDNLLDVYYVKHYAYIGSKWIEGNSADGGCYYFKYIRKYMSSERASVVEQACNSGNAIPTNDEDQLAYSKWQIESSVNQRKAIFNIDAENCEEGFSGSCTLYSQMDPKWGSTHLGNSSYTMSSAGCAVTALAIGISCSGTEVTIQDFDAGKFINALNSGGCFTGDGDIYWSCSTISSIAPKVKLVNTIRVADLGTQEKIDQIKKYSSSSHIILLQYSNSTTSGHYVVYSSIKGGNFVVKNPAGGKVTEVPIGDVNQMVVYSY